MSQPPSKELQVLRATVPSMLQLPDGATVMWLSSMTAQEFTVTCFLPHPEQPHLFLPQTARTCGLLSAVPRGHMLRTPGMRMNQTMNSGHIKSSSQGQTFTVCLILPLMINLMTPHSFTMSHSGLMAQAIPAPLSPLML